MTKRTEKLFTIAVACLVVTTWLALRQSVPVTAQVKPRAYSVTVGGQATTAAILLSIEASATEGFRLQDFCIGTSGATAAAAVTVTVRRTTTASASGTQVNPEQTGTTSVTDLIADTTATNFPGVARLNGTPGTAGATIGQYGFMAGTLAAQTEPYCKTFNPPVWVQKGVTSGVSINVSAAGSGGLASGSITATILPGL